MSNKTERGAVERPKRLRIDDTVVYVLYTIMAGLVAAGVGKKEEKSAPPQVIEQAQKRTPDTALQVQLVSEAERVEEEKFQKLRGLMRDLVASFDRGEHTIAFPLFDDTKSIDAQGACTLIDEWYKQEKVHKNIQRLWNYLQKNKDTAWNENLNNSLVQGLRVSSTIAKVTNMWVIPKNFWVPTEIVDLEARLNSALQKTPSANTSCGRIFTMAFNYLLKEKAITPLRESLALFIKGSAKALLKQTEGKKVGTAQEEIETMYALVSILDSLPDEKAGVRK